MLEKINYKKEFLNSTNFLTLIFLTVFLACQFFTNNSYASTGIDSGLGRTRTCNINGEPEGLDFNRYNGGKDSEFVLANPVCASVATYSYSSVKTAIAFMNSTCKTGSAVPRLTPSLIQDSIDIAKAEMASQGNQACAVTIPFANLALKSAIIMLKSIHEVAEHVYDNSQICGADWIGPNTKKFINNNPVYKKKVQDTIEEYIEQEKLHPNLASKMNFSDKTYREWYYDGVEIEDNPASGAACLDVTQPQSESYGKDLYPKQKYYLRGLETGNFNCKKYDLFEGQTDPRDGGVISAARQEEFRTAYDCCLKRSQHYICIEYDNERKFCPENSRCEIKDIYFSTTSKDNGRLLCAESYSLCPYNFYLGGGSEVCDYFQDGIWDEDEDRYTMITGDDVKDGNCASKSEIRNNDCTYNSKAGKCKNYCQYMKHCTITNSHYQYRSSISSPYFSSACLNFTGDSQNRISYGVGFIAGSARHFSAPVTQCMKETLENIFFNKAGHSRCLLEGDHPDSRGICSKGNAYKKGDFVKNQSFFTKLQSILEPTVKMILTLSIVFYGLKTLVGQGQIQSKELFMYIIKIGLVMYFATGDAWQTMFFDGVYSSSTVFAQMVFKLQTPDEDNKRDGCQFGNLTDYSGKIIGSAAKYPEGKEYLAIFDTLDCKMARYLGFGPEASTSNLALLVAAGWITGAAGIYFSIALLAFGIILISATIRVIHIFLSSFFAILLMVYVSPLAITCSLFAKTNGIFKGWINQLLSYVLQPMILLAYIAIFISILDKTLIGSATFHGEPPNRYLLCKEFCTDSLGAEVDKVTSLNCSRLGDKLNMPKVDSFACMISIKGFDSWPGLELLGISLPFIVDLFLDHTKEKILTITKAALIVYFLTSFLDQIPGITSQLLGGAILSNDKSTPNFMKMFGATTGLLRGIQKRGNRGAIGLVKRAAGTGKKTANKAGNKGKSTQGKEKAEAQDRASSSSHGTSDSDSSDSGSDYS